jgi:anthranilate phosphoribosyltransferase
VVEQFKIDPTDYGHGHDSLLGLTVETAQESADLIKQALGTKSKDKSAEKDAVVEKARSIIALNAGAGIYVSGICSSLREGITLADDVIASGQALDKLETFAAFSYGLKATPV